MTDNINKQNVWLVTTHAVHIFNISPFPQVILELCQIASCGLVSGVAWQWLFWIFYFVDIYIRSQFTHTHKIAISKYAVELSSKYLIVVTF
jgi:predicted transporter